ncbi:MAG: NMD3-related protein [Candidatus Woesearchaeota archaeon]
MVRSNNPKSHESGDSRQKCLHCGKPALDGEVHNLCKKCFLDSYSNVHGFKGVKGSGKFSLSVCINCNSYCYGRQFRIPIKNDENFQKTIRKAVLENTIFDKRPDIFEINAVFPSHTKKQGTKLNLNVDVYVLTKIILSGIRLDNEKQKDSEKQKQRVKDTLIKEEEYTLPLKFRYTICDKCNLANSNYFEGRIQLRNDKNNQFEKATEFIRSRVNSEKGSAKYVYITKEDKVKNGIDFYITSQKFIQPIGKQLLSKFGGELKVTSSLHTMDSQTSKELYRVDVLLRLTDFNVGDILSIGDKSNKKFLLVKEIKGKEVNGIDLKTNKKANENYTRKEHEVIAAAKDYKEAVVLSEYHGNQKNKSVRQKIIRQKVIKILHPDTYQPVNIENTEDVKIKKEKDGDKIDIVIIGRKVYAVSL